MRLKHINGASTETYVIVDRVDEAQMRLKLEHLIFLSGYAPSG